MSWPQAEFDHDRGVLTDLPSTPCTITSGQTVVAERCSNYDPVLRLQEVSE